MQGVSRLPNSTLFVVEPGYLGQFLARALNQSETYFVRRDQKGIADPRMLCLQYVQLLRFNQAKAGSWKLAEFMISSLKSLISLATKSISLM